MNRQWAASWRRTGTDCHKSRRRTRPEIETLEGLRLLAPTALAPGTLAVESTLPDRVLIQFRRAFAFYQGDWKGTRIVQGEGTLYEVVKFRFNTDRTEMIAVRTAQGQSQSSDIGDYHIVGTRIVLDKTLTDGSSFSGVGNFPDARTVIFTGALTQRDGSSVPGRQIFIRQTPDRFMLLVQVETFGAFHTINIGIRNRLHSS